MNKNKFQPGVKVWYNGPFWREDNNILETGKIYIIDRIIDDTIYPIRLKNIESLDFQNLPVNYNEIELVSDLDELLFDPYDRIS